MAKNISIHGHFYQPPRQNPFTGEMLIDSYVYDQTNGKYSNWNDVIHDECYKPNADEGNFSLITFDLYRTLAEWLEQYHTNTYSKIIQNDSIAFQNDGFGSAFTGSWDHAILPLLTPEDQELEIVWGIQDFNKRFGHDSIGFWLAETGVSYNVLDILAKQGIKIIILAPWQVQSQVDTTKMYYVSLRDNRRITVAFYDKPLSDALSFDSGAMINADTFADKYLSNSYLPESHFRLGATDGERYGHHLKDGDKFLKQLLTQSISNIGFQSKSLVKTYLESQPKDEIFIRDNTSWSCLCGDLKRWKQDCDCCIDYDRNNMRVSGDWKGIMFNAIMSLSQNLVSLTDSFFSKMLINPQLAKKEYIHIHLRQTTESEFLLKHQRKGLDATEVNTVMNLFTMQIYRLASFTSCGWFFADIDRPEPRIVIGNAKKALSFVGEIGQIEYMLHLERVFVEELAKAKSNFTQKTGKDLYLEFGPLLTT